MERLSLRLFFSVLFVFAVGLSLTGCEGYEARKEAFVAKGQELFEAGDDARARLELKNALQIDNKLGQAWYLLGRIEERAGEPGKALADYKLAIEAVPDLVDARARKAKLQAIGGDLAGAEEEIKQVLAQQPDNAVALVARAVLRKRQGDVDAAEADARAALDVAAGDASATAVLAGILFEREAFDEAAEVLQAGIKVNPSDIGLRLVLGRVYDRQGNRDGAIAVLRDLIELKPDDLGYRERLVNYYLALQRADDAESVLRDSLAVASDDFARQRPLIQFLARVRGLEVAQAEVDDMLARQPDAVMLHFAKAELLRAAKDNAGAEAIYRELLDGGKAVGPDAVKARNALAQLLLGANRDDEAAALIDATLAESVRDPDALQLRAMLSLRRDDPAQAVADLRSVLRDHPDRVQAHRLLGQAHAKAEEYALAQDAFEKAIELAPTEPLAYLQLAEARVRSGDADGALSLLEELLTKVPDNAAVQQAISRIQLSQRDWGALSKTAERLKATRPDHPLGYHLEGLSLQQAGQQAAAIAAFDRALAIRPGAVEPLIAVARSELILERFDAAEQRVGAVLKDNPGNVFARNLLGDIYVASGKLDQGREQFEEAVRFHPKSPRAYARLAQLQIADGDSAAARKTLQQGIAETNRSGLLVLQLAGLLGQLGEYTAAIEAYEDVVARFPNAVVAVNNLAVLLSKEVGDRPALDRALELAGRFADAEVPEFLDTLGWVHHLRGDYAAAQPYLEKAAKAKPDLASLRYHLGLNLIKVDRADEAREHLAAAAATEGFAERDAARAALNGLGAGG